MPFSRSGECSGHSIAPIRSLLRPSGESRRQKNSSLVVEVIQLVTGFELTKTCEWPRALILIVGSDVPVAIPTGCSALTLILDNASAIRDFFSPLAAAYSRRDLIHLASLVRK